MAEIHIQEKKSKTWLWVLALIAIALIAWYLISQMNDSPELAAGGDTTAVATAAAPVVDDGGIAGGAAVASFLAYVDSGAAPAMGLDHAYTSQGIQRLASAIDALASRDSLNGAALAPQLEQLRERAQQLQAEQQSTRHADLTRQAFTEASALLSAMQERSFPNLAEPVAAVRTAAEGVKAGVPLLEQKESVQQFFTRTAEAVRAMAGTA